MPHLFLHKLVTKLEAKKSQHEDLHQEPREIRPLVDCHERSIISLVPQGRVGNVFDALKLC